MFEIFVKLFLSLSIILVPAAIYTESAPEKVPKWASTFFGTCTIGWIISVFGMIWSA